MKVAVVTAIIGGIDEPKAIPRQTVEHERNLFTGPVIGTLHMTDRLQALWYKTQIHEAPGMSDSGPPDVFIWLDGKVQVQSADFLQQILDALGDGDIAVMKHLQRGCIYDEVKHIHHCIIHGNQYLATRYADKPLDQQISRYRAAGYPAKAGLYDCCIIAVRNNEKMKNVYEMWWAEVQKGYFDQISLAFWCWAHLVKIKPIVFKPGSFIDVPHKILK